MEILRDPIRLSFAFLGPIVLMFAVGYGISFDVENLAYAAFDQDRSRESRELLENFSGSRYFEERPEIKATAELDHRLETGELKVAIEIPPDFGKDLLTGKKQLEIGVWVDGAMPFRAETARGYVAGIALTYLTDQAARTIGPGALSLPVRIETRFRYNQAFKSVFNTVPSCIMVVLMLIPAMMTAVGIVREKEAGSIANFRSTPITRLEFLLGKQLPYIAIGTLSFIMVLLMAAFVFHVPVKGSLATLCFGTLVYLCASTAFGLVVSAMTTTQVAATFATTVLSITPAVNFSGLIVPVSSLQGIARALGLGFPAAWYEQISLGTMAKGLGFAELWPYILVLAGFAVGFVAVSALALRKQER
jgi:ribosome-dependent ATPase